MNLLFVCSKNKWRSPTGENVFRSFDGVPARSVGTSRQARRHVSVVDIRWADIIFAMEEKHLSRMRGDFRGELKHKNVHVLDILDEYQFMDPELVDLILDAVTPLIDGALSGN